MTPEALDAFRWVFVALGGAVVVVGAAIAYLLHALELVRDRLERLEAADQSPDRSPPRPR